MKDQISRCELQTEHGMELVVHSITVSELVVKDLGFSPYRAFIFTQQKSYYSVLLGTSIRNKKNHFPSRLEKWSAITTPCASQKMV